MLDVEKKTPLEDVAPELEVESGDVSASKAITEEERRVRWKIDMVVLPMVRRILMLKLEARQA